MTPFTPTKLIKASKKGVIIPIVKGSYDDYVLKNVLAWQKNNTMAEYKESGEEAGTFTDKFGEVKILYKYI